MKIIRFLALLALLLFVALSTLLQGQGIESTLQEPQFNPSKYFEIILENLGTIGAILGGFGTAIAAYATYSAWQSKKSIGEFHSKFRNELFDEGNIKDIKDKAKLFSENDPMQLERFITHMIAQGSSALRNTIEKHCFVGGTLEFEAKKMQAKHSSENLLGGLAVVYKTRT